MKVILNTYVPTLSSQYSIAKLPHSQYIIAPEQSEHEVEKKPKQKA